MRRIWQRLDRPDRVALLTGVVLAVLTIPLSALVSLVIGLAACGVLGYLFPERATRVGVLVAVPVLTVSFLVGLVRGFTVIVLVIFLVCSLVLPVAVARFGAQARRGPA